MAEQTFVAAALGLLEGLTEFIPVSSTGHLLLVGHFAGFQSAGNTFEVVIQLGAVLALVVLYFARLWTVFSTVHSDPASRRFVVAVLVAFLPAAFAGLLLHDVIKTVLFESPMLIAVMLIVGGVVLLCVDRLTIPVQVEDAADMSLRKALGIGLFQCLALVPGVSRSGSTIVGALVLGVSKRAAAEFSFFLSMPTMGAAVAYDLYKNRDVLDFSAMSDIAIGFGVAFVTALLVVRWVLGYVSRQGYALFGWWRIIVGTGTLAALWAGY